MTKFLVLGFALLTSLALGADAPADFTVGAFKFQRPPEWGWVQVNSPMRKAQLSVPGKAGAAAAEITFFHFGAGQGGDVQSNAQRWVRQFKSAEGAEKIEWIDFGPAKGALVSTEGTFQSGMPGGPATPMENYALLGAILEHPEGAVFIKMTGPAATVKDAAPKFQEFVKSASKP